MIKVAVNSNVGEVMGFKQIKMIEDRVRDFEEVFSYKSDYSIEEDINILLHSMGYKDTIKASVSRCGTFISIEIEKKEKELTYAEQCRKLEKIQSLKSSIDELREMISFMKDDVLKKKTSKFFVKRKVETKYVFKSTPRHHIFERTYNLPVSVTEKLIEVCEKELKEKEEEFKRL